MRVLVGTNLFYPLNGGGERALIDWLNDFHLKGIEICVITTTPEIENLEREFPFQVIRLQDKIPYSEKIDNEGVQNYLQEIQYNHYEMIDKAMLILSEMNDFDFYIGYGFWGSEWLIDGYKSFATVLKEQYPKLKTISLKWDVHGGEGEYDTDYVLHGAPYKYINNPHTNKVFIKRFSMFPKQTTDNPLEVFNFEEWKNRPYDFLFNNPQLNKGSLTVLEIAKKYPNKRFLIKMGNWGSWNNNEIIQLNRLGNVNIINSVKSMENEFYRLGKYLLSPSVIDGGGMMPLEAAMQGTIPICSNIGILRYSSSPYAEFVFSEELTYNALNKMIQWNGYDKINFELVAKDWFDKIDFLDKYDDYVEDTYNNLKYVEKFVIERYYKSLDKFIRELFAMIE